MKKFIISTLTLVIGVALFSTTAFAADAAFNSPAPMQTISVTNSTTSPCSFGAIDGCWKSSATAKPGDIIAVHLYYKNTSGETARGTTVSIRPSRNGNLVSFSGGVVAQNADRVTGNASVTLSKTTTITTLLGDQRPDWRSSYSGGPREVNVNALFGNGFAIGDIPAGEQGTIVVRFRVDGDSTPDQECTINSFNANPSTIVKGNSSTLSWNTTNCQYVNITALGQNEGSNLSPTSTRSVSPESTRTYTLTAYPGGKVATATVTVNNGGGGNNDNCYINSFNASPSNLNYSGSTTLNWDTSNCDYVNISPSGGNNLGADGSRSVYVGNTTTYTLTAYPGGQTSSTTVYVNNGGGNNNACYINSFYADSNSILQGQTTTLRWNTSGSGSVYLSGFGNQNGNGAISVSPYYTTTYTLSLNGYNCSNSSQSVTITVNQNNNGGPSYQQPQAITTVGNALSAFSAQLNGIAVPNTNYGTANAWFEYGPTTALGSRSDTQSVGGSGSSPYSANISGLTGGRTYYFRAVVQTNAGTAYGSVVSFTTPNNTTYTPPARVVYVNSATTTRSNSGLVANSQASLFKLRVDSTFDRMCLGGNIDYTVTYENISGQQLSDSVLRITFPGELNYVSGSRGDYSVVDRTLTIPLGTVQPGEQGSVTVRARVNDTAVQGKLAVITATMVYTNPVTRAQENAIAYSLITISNDCPAVLGASVFGFGSFLPQTLLQWLLLILVILALIVLARMLYRKNEKSV